MQADPLLKKHIKTLDCLLADDIWEFCKQPGVQEV